MINIHHPHPNPNLKINPNLNLTNFDPKLLTLKPKTLMLERSEVLPD